MAKYRILVIQHLLKNNVIAQSGDEIDEDQFTIHPGQLEKEGFVELVDEDGEGKVSKKASKK